MNFILGTSRPCAIERCVRAGVAGRVAAALAAAGSAGFQGRRSLRAPVGTAAAPFRHTSVLGLLLANQDTELTPLWHPPPLLALS